jgi:hypothetical protein
MKQLQLHEHSFFATGIQSSGAAARWREMLSFIHEVGTSAPLQSRRHYKSNLINFRGIVFHGVEQANARQSLITSGAYPSALVLAAVARSLVLPFSF